jgi:hypothetical protein
VKSQQDIEIEVSGEVSEMLMPFAGTTTLPRLRPVGVSVRYGINTVPQMTLDLTPDDLPLVCDFEPYRRTPVRAKVLSVNGCLDFEGLVDGLSLSQSPGSLQMQLEVKHPFQVFLEINPQLLGYHAAGVDFTARVPVLEKQFDETAPTQAAYRIALATYYNANLQLPYVDGVLEILRIILRSQAEWERIQTLPGISARPAIQAARATGRRHLDLALALLDRIDTTYVKTHLTLQDHYAMESVLENIMATRSNLWDILLSLLNDMGCGLTVSRDRAYVVPMSGFLRRQHARDIAYQAQATEPNIAYPVQYTSLGFNDSGYRDVSGVYLIASVQNRDAVDAFYQDPTALAGRGGILGVDMPYLIAFNSTAVLAAASSLQGMAHGDPLRASTPAADRTGVQEADQAAAVAQLAELERLSLDEQTLVNNARSQAAVERSFALARSWAEQEYYKIKLTDRIGGIQGEFQPRFVPGAAGSIYLRHPGVYIDCYVTAVSHTLRMQAPDQAEASTSVSFNGGRIGSTTSSLISVSGLEEFAQFQVQDAPGPTGGFTAGTSDALARAWLDNQAANLEPSGT